MVMVLCSRKFADSPIAMQNSERECKNVVLELESEQEIAASLM